MCSQYNGDVADWPGQERLAALVELSTDAVMLVDAADAVTWASPSVRQVLGFEPADVVGTHLPALVAAEDLDAWRAFADDVRRNEGTWHRGTFRMRQRSGCARRLSATAGNLLSEPRIGAIVVTLRAVGESGHDAGVSRDVLAAPSSPRDRYRQLFEDAADVIFETDAEGYFTLINPAALRLLGWSESEVLGRRFTEFIRPEYRPLIFAHYRRQIDTGERTSYIEFPALTRDRGEMWLGQNAWLVLDDKGRFVGMRAVARDIGERRRTDQALLQAQKMEAGGRLAGGIAHDFNNLLTAIRGNAELLLHQLKKNRARAAEAEEILRAADRGRELRSEDAETSGAPHGRRRRNRPRLD